MFGNLHQDPLVLAALVPLFIASITLHEFGHAAAALALGDTTARDAGRVTLNPLAHLDLFGTLFILLAGFGWAKPVPFDPSRLKSPRLGSFLVSAAGPATNFALALVALFAMKHLPSVSAGTQMWLQILFSLNLMLMVFNLLPIPPLDGGNLIEAVLPRSLAPSFQRLLPYGVFILLLLVLLPGPYNPLRWLYALAARGMMALV
ncbi:MAG: site-2 protease family protein [Candidatus Sericytochromatia bacterium]|jgi:Zn-dependent protease|nr:site-2 protease family protein [Candidatus Sericytochromatia bacterium]